MVEIAISELVTKATEITHATDRCVWGHGWPWEDHGLAAAIPCPNESDMEITIGRRGSTEVRVCGEHFMATADLMHREWRISAEIVR